MCGIAGYSLSGSSSVDRTLSAQSLLAGIAERGADAVGYAHRGPSGPVEVHKQRSGASELLDQITIPTEAVEALVHVRDYTKGHPSIAANNHPVRHGPVVGIHNGIITNDDELLERHHCARAEPQMTVDSEAIFAVAAHSRSNARALEELEGAMAAAWLDEREPELVHLARGTGRPLWLVLVFLLDQLRLVQKRQQRDRRLRGELGMGFRKGHSLRSPYRPVPWTP